jgi:hexosaminidase
MSICRFRLFLLAVSLLLPGAPFSAAQALKLIPIPREVSPGAVQSLAGGVQINCVAPCAPEDSFAIDDLKSWLATLGVTVDTTSSVNILVARYGSTLAHSIYTDSLPLSNAAAEMSDEMKPEGYAIIPDGKGLALTAATDSGIFYALQTVKQLITGYGTNAVLHAAKIRDWPAMKYRGLDDDLSRGPVTTLDFEKKMVRTIAAYKINLYSPYFEHTAAYASNPLIAPPGGGISASDAAALVAYARPYHVTIVPEQEAFGHLHNALIWEQYQPLAENPHGAVLSPTQPGSIALIKQEFSELAAEYPSPFLHIGADETVDLGIGQTKTDVDARGLGQVYLDFLQQIVAALQPLQRKLLFWGDIAVGSPDLLKAVPQSFRSSTIAIAWEYNPQPKGYSKLLTPFTNAGFETWVSPSVHNFRVVYPDNNMALLQHSAVHSRRPEARLDRPAQHHLERRWRGPLQPGLVRHSLRRGSRVAARRIVDRGVRAELRPGLPRRCHRRAQPGAARIDGRPLRAEGPGQGRRRHQQHLLARPVVEGRPEDRRPGPPVHARPAHARRSRPDPDRTGARRSRPESRGRDHRPTEVSTMYDAAKFGAAGSALREPDAIDAMELGARRMDFIGLKFQLADEMAAGYARALADSTSPDRKLRATVTANSAT